MKWRPLPVLSALAAWLSLSALPLFAQDDINELLEKAIKASMTKVAPSVVQIETVGGTELISTGPRGMQIRKGVGPTTGVAVDAEGFVISSAFNFANKPQSIFVMVPGHKKRYTAEIWATDHTRMLTLLKLNDFDKEQKLVVPTATPKKDILVGHTAVALGRTVVSTEDKDLSQPPTVSIGIISALHRIWGKALQTDAKVSPGNYGGPLIDIQGRIQGILVPASPRDEGVLSGVEWYDSGIGFAIPLEDINTVLPRLKAKKDLRAGQLGITMQGNMYDGKPTVATIQPDSAAVDKLKVGDVILSVNDKEVKNQAQLRHELGNKYDGDTITLAVTRDGKNVVIKDILLANKVGTFVPGFLGILALRDDPEAGEEIRFVYPKSPADAAGLKVGDRITKVQAPGMPMAQEFAGRDVFSTLMSRMQPGAELKLEVLRKDGGKTETITVKLAGIPDDVPEKLPLTASARKALEPRKGPNPPPAPKKPDKKAETGLLKRATAAGDHQYYAYVPDKYDENVSHAVVLWLHPVGKGKEKDIESIRDAWEDYCAANNLILVMPVTESEKGWQGTDTDWVVQSVRDTMGQYTTDPRRVVAHGMGVGGQFAMYLGFKHRDLFRGVATTGAVLGNPPQENVAGQPLSFFLVVGGKDTLVNEVAETKNKLVDKKYPVVHRVIKEQGHEYHDLKTLSELARWIDSLDRQ